MLTEAIFCINSVLSYQSVIYNSLMRLLNSRGNTLNISHVGKYTISFNSVVLQIVRRYFLNHTGKNVKIIETIRFIK